MSITDVADRSRELIQSGQFANAERLIEDELQAVSLDASHSDALYILAVSQRYQKKYTAALSSILQLLVSDPTYARAYQEQGHTYLAQDNDDKARASYERAVELNSALLSSWKALEKLYDEAGYPTELVIARDRAKFLSELPRELLTVTSMICDGKLYQAERICRHFLQNNKHDIEAMRLLAEIGSRLDVPGDPEFLLESCVELAPDYDRARYDYANFLLKMQKFEFAAEQIRFLLKKDPENLSYKSMLANATAGLGDPEGAIEIYDDVLSSSKNQNMLYVMRGHAQKTIGMFDEAIASYREAYNVKPDYGDAFWSLANTKTYRFTEQEIAHMRDQEEAETTPNDDRIHLCFALGKAYEDRSEYDESFKYYSRGNDLKRSTVRHKETHLSIRVKAQKDICNAELFAEKGDLGYDAPDPIFIVGLPRAGSTLLEQILASHSMVDGTFEIPNIIALAQRLRGSQYLVDIDKTPYYPKILTEIDDSYFARFGKQFIEQTRIYRQKAPYFIDKNPNNFFHIGLIRLILPNAKIIDARRHPMSCCFSGFKQLFGQGQEFSYGLKQIGNYYREYVELMNHWDDVLPNFVLRVQHEDVVDNLDTQVARILDFCGLPFEDACVEFHKTERSIRTPSAEQVRQPIYKSGLDQWRHFEPWLSELKEALGPIVLERYPIN